MGFQRPAKTYRLVFEDPAFDGLEIRARSVPVGMFVKLVALAANAKGSAVPEIAELFDAFAGALVEWNLTDVDADGKEVPVPATREAVHAQDVDFMLAIALAWMQAIGDVDAPLGAGSTNGGPGGTQILPMEPLSPPSDPPS